MEILRTPDERFENLPGYPSRPHHAEVDGVRIHYVDEGPRERRARPPAPRRAVVVVPLPQDDPPARRRGTSRRARRSRRLRPLRQADAHARTTRTSDTSTGSPGSLGPGSTRHHPLLPGLGRPDRAAPRRRARGSLRPHRRRQHLPAHRRRPSGAAHFAHGSASPRNRHSSARAGVVKGGCADRARAGGHRRLRCAISRRSLSRGRSPVPHVGTHYAGRSLPPSRIDALGRSLEQWTKPFLTAFSDGDPITRGADRVLQQRIPGALGQPHTTIVGAGHFLQEDKGEELAQYRRRLYRRHHVRGAVAHAALNPPIVRCARAGGTRRGSIGRGGRFIVTETAPLPGQALALQPGSAHDRRV